MLFSYLSIRLELSLVTLDVSFKLPLSIYRTRNFHQANFDLLFRHNQEHYCNSYFPRTVKLWKSLPNIFKSSQDLLWFRVHLYDHFRGLLQTYSPP